MTAAGALLRATHPLPALAVTVFGTALGASAGAGGVDLALLAGALACGQASVGWSNDLADAGRDRAAGRSEKPLASGDVGVGAVRVALVVAVAGCVVLSLLLGAVPGVLHLVAVASAWAYNLLLKSTVASPLPYLVSFGLLPVIAATLAGSPVRWPLAVAAGVLGVAAHFANTVPDEEADAATGVRGLPQRIGARASQVVAAGGVVAAAGVLLLGEGLGWVATTLLAVACGVGVASLVAPARLAFRLTLLAAAVAVAGVVAA
ncbi:UbiA family prenyltransferase [Thalassiella azotivora]